MTTSTRRRTISLFVATASLAGSALVASTTAEAATTVPPSSTAGARSGTSAPDLSFCLVYSNGAAYANKPVYLYWYDYSAKTWRQWRSGSTNAYGCGKWNDVVPNVTYAVQGYWSYRVGAALYAYTGWTPSKNVGNVYDGQYSTGTGTVWLQRLA